MAAHELTWTNQEVAALMDVWSAYTNDHIYRRIAVCNLFTKYAKVVQLTQKFVLKLASFQPGTMS